MAAYPSIYRAKAVKYEAPVVTAFVPQIFGETAIEITDFIGTPAAGMGWVLFQGGDPEFPVWSSGLSGGGSVSDVVWVDPSEPGADMELWYDTDEVATQYVKVTGDTMTGTLVIDASPGLRLQRDNDSPYLSFVKRDGTRMSYIQTASNGNMLIFNDTPSGQIQFYADDADGTSKIRMNVNEGGTGLQNGKLTLLANNNLTKLLEVGDGIEALLVGNNVRIGMTDVAGNRVTGVAGINTSFILPRGAGAADVEGFLTGKSFRMELGLEVDQRFRITCFGEDRAWINNGGDASFVGTVTTGTLRSNGAWKAWTPTLSNWGLSNGTLVGSYSEINDTVFFRFKLTLGSSTTKVGTPVIGGFPVPIHADFFSAHFPLGLYLSTMNGHGVGRIANSSQATLDALSTESGTNPVHVGNGGITSTVPQAWVTGDSIVGTGFYRRA